MQNSSRLIKQMWPFPSSHTQRIRADFLANHETCQVARGAQTQPRHQVPLPYRSRRTCHGGPNGAPQVSPPIVTAIDRHEPSSLTLGTHLQQKPAYTITQHIVPHMKRPKRTRPKGNPSPEQQITTRHDAQSAHKI